MEDVVPDAVQPEVVNHRALAVALIDISSDVRRKSHEGTGVPPLPNGVLEILRAIETQPGITVADVASRLGRQLSNVSTQLRELEARGLVTRTRDAADRRYVTLNPTAESLRMKTLFEKAWSDALQAATSRLSPVEQARIQESLPALQRLATVLGESE